MKKGDRVIATAQAVNQFGAKHIERKGTISTNPRKGSMNYAVTWDGSKYPEYIHQIYIERL